MTLCLCFLIYGTTKQQPHFYFDNDVLIDVFAAVRNDVYTETSRRRDAGMYARLRESVM